ncbi:MAG: heavy metal translocating P-type ATPase metal-binding domain-containing protein [Burkholderiales bacterium]|nr:heavy metal translocating P-type ATPase metal-binding domain-containing protein [Burkholderiales bacterium]
MLKQLFQGFFRGRRLRPACFHCGEPVLQEVILNFAGESRLLCCHGCASVLQAIAEAGQTAAYLAEKRNRAESGI